MTGYKVFLKIINQKNECPPNIYLENGLTAYLKVKPHIKSHTPCKSGNNGLPLLKCCGSRKLNIPVDLSENIYSAPLVTPAPIPPVIIYYSPNNGKLILEEHQLQLIHRAFHHHMI